MIVRVIDILDCRGRTPARLLKLCLTTNNGKATISYLIPREQSIDHTIGVKNPEQRAYDADKVYETKATELVLAAEEFERIKGKLLEDSCLVMEKVVAKEKA